LAFPGANEVTGSPANAEISRDNTASQSQLMAGDWCGFEWGPWVPLKREAVRQTVPPRSGIYRIRRAGGNLNRLVYIGQTGHTGRTLRARLLRLAAKVNGNVCPFNDPHTAAPHLWLLHKKDGVRFECSCAPVQGDVQVLRGTEDMLLWRHRVTTGWSTEANYGRFYPGYIKSTNRWIGKKSAGKPGRRAAPVPEGTAIVDYSVSRPPLQGDAGPLQARGWKGIALSKSNARTLPRGPAVYIVYDRGAKAATYIGQTNGLRRRAAAHASSQWPIPEPWLAYLSLPEGTPKHVLLELETDLLGWHFWHTNQAPTLQYLERQQKAGKDES
jgi:hypothetical protein